MTRPSPLFLCCMAGIGVTLFSWYGPWAWPAFPAFAAIGLFFGSHENFAELSHERRALWVTLLVAVNSLAWALLFRGSWWAWGKFARGSEGLGRRHEA